MFTAAIIFLALACLTGLVAGGAWVMAVRLAPAPKRRPISRWLCSWALKGLGGPILIWALMNVGLAYWLPPFLPAIQAARNHGGDWVPEFLEVAGQGAIVVGSYWAGLTLGWVLLSARATLPPETRKDFRALCLTSTLGLGIPAIFIVLLSGWCGLGFAITLMLAPIVGYAPGLLFPKPMPPMYARAVARMKFGKYNEAEWEIIRELEKCQDDFEGWLMLAGLYADQFRDLGGAERTILDLCEQPQLTAPQLSIALNRLADWYLKIGNDPASARRSLQIICNRLPGSHLAHMAQQRLKQLPRTAEQLKQQSSPKAIPLPALGDHFDEPPDADETPADRNLAKFDAEECVAILTQDPDHADTREKLARLLAEKLGHAEQGIEQLKLLLDMPAQPIEKRADWLSLLAAWHFKYRNDAGTGRQILERLVKEFPESPQAFSARHRLGLVGVHAKNQPS